METCLLSPVGYPTSPAGVVVVVGGGLVESACHTCPEAHLSTRQQQLLSLSLCFSHFLCLFIFPQSFISLPRTLSVPSLQFRLDKTNNSHLGRWASP